ncbi:hypothetical protein RDWZM_003886 [Blomia tropicalis]|uniref:RRM domain-containing protein n=1 Tax=Blomia tropicalis TaxID=40697 RepID=A0A9Q0RTF9_BLOTA|nr:hypothetical protein RDWZM_003886 [Blomia tropicalis]
MLENSIQESKSLLINLATVSKYRIAQENGQRIFGPPLDWSEDVFLPEKGTEVFVGKIPRDCFESELIPLFQKPGQIYKMRLMIDFSGKNRGYGFVQYFNRENAKLAVSMLNNYEIRKNWFIGVMPSKNNNRLFFGNLPNNISRTEMVAEISKYTCGIKGAIYYGGLHRANGFGFVEYDNHKMTALARRKFFPGSILLFGRQPKVDWAKSEEDCEEDDHLRSILYVRFFKPDTTEDQIKCVDLSKTMLNEPDQELEIKWAKNRPISPASQLGSTSPSAKSPKTSHYQPSSYKPHYQQQQNSIPVAIMKPSNYDDHRELRQSFFSNCFMEESNSKLSPDSKLFNLMGKN